MNFVLVCLIQPNETFLSNYLNIYRTDLCEICRIGRTLAVDKRSGVIFSSSQGTGGSVAEWLACWTQAQMGLGSNRSHNGVGLLPDSVVAA